MVDIRPLDEDAFQRELAEQTQTQPTTPEITPVTIPVTPIQNDPQVPPQPVEPNLLQVTPTIITPKPTTKWIVTLILGTLSPVIFLFVSSFNDYSAVPIEFALYLPYIGLIVTALVLLAVYKKLGVAYGSAILLGVVGISYGILYKTGYIWGIYGFATTSGKVYLAAAITGLVVSAGITTIAHFAGKKLSSKIVQIGILVVAFGIAFILASTGNMYSMPATASEPPQTDTTVKLSEKKNTSKLPTTPDMPALAAEGGTYSDSVLSFDYPAGWETDKPDALDSYAIGFRTTDYSFTKKGALLSFSMYSNTYTKEEFATEKQEQSQKNPSTYSQLSLKGVVDAYQFVDGINITTIILVPSQSGSPYHRLYISFDSPELSKYKPIHEQIINSLKVKEE